MAAFVTERFDRWAPAYDESCLQRLVYEPAHQAVIGLCAHVIDSPRYVVDIGCGTGRLFRVAGARWPGAVLLGVDISMGMLQTARQRDPTGLSPGRRPLLVRAAVEALPFASGRVDLVTATLTYRHWDDQAAGLAQIRRILSPDGVLGMATICVPPTTAFNRFRRRGNLEALASRLAAAGLAIRNTTTLTVTGPIPQVTILIAQPEHSPN